MARISAAALAAALLFGGLLSEGVAGAANDPLSPQQWSLAKIGAETAWSRSTGAGIRIGIVDTGVDLHHEDLGAKVVASTNCIGANGDPRRCAGNGQDDEGHGSHVSGTAAASTNNGKGVAGVAPDAQLVVAKGLDSGGGGNTADINAAIEWVVGQGAKVVNLSLGSDLPLITAVAGSPLSDGIEFAWAHGAVPVLAAGNTNVLGLGSSDYGDLHAIVVGSTGPDDEVAGYSSPTGNARWAVVAPGGDGVDAGGQPSCEGSAGPRCILSTYWRSGGANAYGFDEGTSMAAPHVAGAIALLLAQGRSQQDAVNTLLGTVNTSVSCGRGSTNCHGRLDLARAVGAGPAAPTGPPTTAGSGNGGAGSGSGGSPSAPGAPARPGSVASTAPPPASSTAAAQTAPPSGQPAGGAPGAAVAAPPAGPAGAADAAGSVQEGASAAGGAVASTATHHRSTGGITTLSALLALALAVLAAAAGATAWVTRRRAPIRAGGAR